MKAKVKRFKWSAPLAVAALAVVGALALFGVVALPNAGVADAQANRCADGGAGFITAPTTAPAAPTVTARNMAMAVTIAAPASNADATVLGSPEYTGFQMEYRRGSSGAWMAFTGTITLNTRDLSGAALITGLENGAAYNVRVRVTCGPGTGEWSAASGDATPAATVPGKVRNLKAVQTYYQSAAPASARVVGSWDPPADDGGSPVTSYKLETFLGGTGDAIAANPTKQTTLSSNTWKNPGAADRGGDITGVGVTVGTDIVAANLWMRFKVAANNSFGTGAEEMVDVRLDPDLEQKLEGGPYKGAISSDSTTSGATPKLTVRVTNLKNTLPVGASVVLFLEDDFQVPDSIPASSVYFVANSPVTTATGNGAPVYATESPEIETDDYFDDDKDDISIRVSIPDMCTGDSDACQGANGVQLEQHLTMVILSSSGIRNPSEAGQHTVAFNVLGFNDEVPGITEPVQGRIERIRDANGMELSAAEIAASTTRDLRIGQGVYLPTLAKISLSDVDGERGDEVTVTGSGFNNGVSAAAYVNQRMAARFAVAQWWETLNCAGMKAAMGPGAGNEFCFHYTLDTAAMTYTVADKDKAASDKVFARHLCDVGIIGKGERVASATVGSDDRVAIPVTVTVPTFKPGNDNLICVADGEGRSSGADYEDFELLPSIRVSPAEAAVGDTITVFAQDFPTQGAGFMELKLAGQTVMKSGTGDDNVGAVSLVSVSSTSISSDGSATATFDLPPHINGVALEGTVRIDAKWGDKSEDAKVTIQSAVLNVSQPSARPNEMVTLTCVGFGSGSGNAIMAEKITLDGVPLKVHSDSLNSDGEVPVSSAGRCVFAAAVWPESDGGANPALTPGAHTIKVVDKNGYTGSVVITIPEPAVKVTPAVAGPRDVVTISGENWPVDNPDSTRLDAITITVTDGEREREYSQYADGTGRWFVEHQVSGAVSIPSTSRIEAKYSDLVRLGEYSVPASIITIEPGECQPGDSVMLTASRLPVHSRIDRVEIGGRDVKPTGAPSTDGDGAVTVAGVVCPGLDEGRYSVLLEVEETVAIGELEILSEGPLGQETPVAEALAPLGDSLAAVFYFDGIGKEWLFYDSRPEFAELNTLTELVAGEPYWVLVTEDVEDVALGGKSRSLTCSAGGNCWNLMVW